MHIEPGVLAVTKIAAANVAALGIVASAAWWIVRRPALLLRTLLAAAFFTFACSRFT